MSEARHKQGLRSPLMAIPSRTQRSSLYAGEDALVTSAIDHHVRRASASRGSGGGGASAGSSAATHASAASPLSRQSSTSGLPAGARSSPEPLGSWAGRQTSFPAAAQHLPVKIPRADPAKLGAAQRSAADTAWRFKFKRNWRREQLKRLVNAAAQKYPSYGSKHDGDGWTEALEALTAAAPALGVRLDAWAGLAAGEPVYPEPSEASDPVLGASEAALALDEEIAGEGLRRPDASAARHSRPSTQDAGGSLKQDEATILPGAYPGTTIRRVPMRGSKPHVSEPMKRSRAARTTSAAVGTVDAVSTWKPPTSKLRQLAAQQLAILGATAQPQPRGNDWVGVHMAQQHVVSGSSAVVVAVQLTDPVSGATRVLIRGAAKGSRARLVADLKQQVKHIAAQHHLAPPHFLLLGSGAAAPAA